MFRRLAMIGLAFGLLGCSKSDAPSEATPLKAQAKADPGASVYEKYRSGLFLLDTAAAEVADALTAAKRAGSRMNGDAKETMLDIVDMLDNSGDNLTEAAIEPPAAEAFDKEFAKYDDQRLKAIASANDSLMELQDALGMLKGVAESDTTQADLATAASKLEAAIEGITEAIPSLGGKIEGQEEPL